jgi:hypothetical protein
MPAFHDSDPTCRNIDRYFAIWQASHNGWIADENAKLARDELYPFRTVKPVEQGRKAFWNSEFVKDVAGLGYTYADIAGTKEEVLARLRENYAWSLHESLRGDIANKPPGCLQPITVEELPFLNFLPNGGKKEYDNLKEGMHKILWETQKVIVKKPAEIGFPPRHDNFDLSDEELLAGKPKGTRLIRQWYINSKVLR